MKIKISTKVKTAFLLLSLMGCSKDNTTPARNNIEIGKADILHAQKEAKAALEASSHTAMVDIDIPEMNELMANIHENLKELKSRYNWLSTYNDKCFHEKKMIYFYPKPAIQPKEDQAEAQQPEHLSIRYIPNQIPKGIKYYNVLEDEESCHFPSLNAKIYTSFIVTGIEAKQLSEEIKRIIKTLCQNLHKKLKPPQ